MCRFLAAVFIALIAVTVARAEALQLRLQTTSLDFGRLLSGASADRSIKLTNPGALPIRIEKIALTPPLRVVRMPREIAAGAEAEIVVRMPSPSPGGRYEGSVSLVLEGLQDVQVIPVSAEVVGAIEFSPRPMFFVAAVRGNEAVASIDIINNESEPLRLGQPSHAGERFTAALETIEQGKRFRLTLRMHGDVPAGRHTETITLETSSKSMPRIGVVAHTLMRERVYTFPEAIDLGAIPIGVASASPDALERLAQTLMVYQVRGRDFQIRFDTDVPGLSVRSVPGPQGDRHQLTLTLDRDKIEVGPIRGVLHISTNDAEWSRIEVPVSGTILPN